MYNIRSSRLVPVLATIAIIGIVVIAGRFVVAKEVFGGSTTTSSSLSAMSSNIEVTLVGYALDSDGTDFTFMIDLPEPAVSSQNPTVVDLPYTNTELLLTNVEPHRSGSYGRVSPHSPGMSAATMEIYLGPIEDPDKDVELRLNRLNFNINDDQRTERLEVDGEWTFRISSDDIKEALEPKEDIAVGTSIEADGVTIFVDRLERGSDGMSAFWSVTASSSLHEIHPAGPGMRMVTDDGAVVEQSRMRTLSEEGWPVPAGATARFSTKFPVVTRSDERVTLNVDPFVTALEASAAVNIFDPLGDWTAEPFQAWGDSFEVTDVSSLPDDDRILNIEIANTVPISEATIMFMGVGTESPTIQDETGREYQILSGSTGMRRSESNNMGAGLTTLRVAIPKGANPSMLTITSPELGQLLKGPWTTEVEIP